MNMKNRRLIPICLPGNIFRTVNPMCSGTAFMCSDPTTVLMDLPIV